jgi:hypothetical protein
MPRKAYERTAFETWRKIRNLEADGRKRADYYVNNRGWVKGPSGVLSPIRGRYVVLYGKRRYVDRLVAEAFIGSVKGKHVWHKNGLLYDNRLVNLELRDEPMRVRKDLEKGIVQKGIDGGVLNVFSSLKQAEEYTGISKGNISACCHRRRPMAGGFVWEFVNPGELEE